MKTRLPAERKIRDVVARENLPKVVFKASEVPVEEIAPKRMDVSQTIVRRMTMAYCSPYLRWSEKDSNRWVVERQAALKGVRFAI
jgi:hypothetical protein